MSLRPAGTWTRAALADLLGGELVGPDGPARALRDPAVASAEDVVVALRPQYLQASLDSPAGLVVLPKDASQGVRPDGALLRVRDAEEAWGTLLTVFSPDLEDAIGVDARACVDESAVLGAGVSVGPLAVVAAGALIGERTRIQAGAYVGEGAVLGSDCLIRPNATVLHGVKLGNRVIVHPGAVIGSDGFGYRRHEGAYEKLPHIGTTILEDDVEIGANSVVDRGTVGETRVGAGTKIGPACIVAHNGNIGRHVIMVGAVQLAGSVTVDDGAVLMGQVGIVGHITIGEGATVTAQSGVSKDLPPGGTYRGSPARPIAQALRLEGMPSRLPDLLQRVAALEQELARLRSASE